MESYPKRRSRDALASPSPSHPSPKPSQQYEEGRNASTSKSGEFVGFEAQVHVHRVQQAGKRLYKNTDVGYVWCLVFEI